jgi:cytohesin
MAPRTILAIVSALLFTGCATPRLYKAADARDLAEVNRRLAAGDPVDARGQNGETPLLVAAAQGSTDIATALLDRGADPNARTADGHTPLHAAAYWGQRDAVELLLARGADARLATRHGETPLHRALWRSAHPGRPGAPLDPALVEASAAVAARLLDRGADPGAADGDGVTPLMLAAASGHPPLVELLVARGAALETPGRDGITALYVAAIQDRPATAEALLARGARVDARTRSGYTPLIHAAKTGSEALAALLVARGADVNARDADGKGPLDWALQTRALASPAGDAAARFLGESAAQRAQRSAALARVEGRWGAVAMLLVGRGADVVAHGPKDPSPLYLAALVGDEALVAALLDRGAPIDEVTVGETALHGAIAERQAGVATLLLRRGARADLVNPSRRTPLHFAAAFLDDAALAEALVARGADVNAVDADGRTALAFATKANHAKVAAVLQAHGAR